MFQAEFPQRDEWSLVFVYTKGCPTLRVIEGCLMTANSNTATNQTSGESAGTVLVCVAIFHVAEREMGVSNVTAL